MCCWHQLPSVLSRHAGRSRGCSPSDRPAVRQHTEELMSTTHTYPWLIPIITWCPSFPFASTNVLLPKSKLKFELRAIAVGVLMSPRNLGSKYRCRPQPGRESARASFMREAERVNRTAPERRHRLTCLKAEFLWHTVLSNENGGFYTYGIYPYLNRSLCLLIGSSLDEGLAFVQAGVPSCAPWWRDAPLVREFQIWGRRCKQWDSHWFQA